MIQSTGWIIGLPTVLVFCSCLLPTAFAPFLFIGVLSSQLLSSLRDPSSMMHSFRELRGLGWCFG